MLQQRLGLVLLLLVVPAFVGCSEPSPAPVARSSPTPDVEPSQPFAEAFNLENFAPPDFEKGGMGIWAKKGRFWAIHSRPDLSSPSRKVKTANPLGQVVRLLVLDATVDDEGVSWFEVIVPERPNGKTGWVRVEKPKNFQLDKLPDRIEVDLSDRHLDYYVNGKRFARFVVGVGTDQYPTPTGMFFVWASVPQPDPNGPYGRFALGLSGFSPVLSDWPGGGRAAIHGTADPGDQGEKVSHGCVRVYNADMKYLQKVPLGTPVLISA